MSPTHDPLGWHITVRLDDGRNLVPGTRERRLLADAVLEAGGLNEFASPNRSKLYRKIKDRTEVFDISLGDILTKGRLETNLVLRPGDVITVPERLF